MPGEGFSGKEGTVFFKKRDIDLAEDEEQPDEIEDQPVCEITKWTFDPTVAISKYNSNKTGGHKKGVAGVADSKGTLEIKVNPTDKQQLQPGQTVELQLVLIPDPTGPNGEEPPEGTPPYSYFYIYEAIIAGAPIECDVDNGEVVGITYAFEASDFKGEGVVEGPQFGSVPETSSSA